jgi:hypothetical protein
VAYVRITDPGAAIPDPGNLIPQADNSGFDLDAIAALHACDPSSLPSATPSYTPSSTPALATATPTSTAQGTTPTPSMTADPSAPTATVTATPTAPSGTPTATTHAMVRGDLDGDGSVTGTDTRLLVAEIYDGDGDAAALATGGAVDNPAADVNGDGRISAADLAALMPLRSQ